MSTSTRSIRRGALWVIPQVLPRAVTPRRRRLPPAPVTAVWKFAMTPGPFTEQKPRARLPEHSMPVPSAVVTPVRV
jgi:hypothetical protein